MRHNVFKRDKNAKEYFSYDVTLPKFLNIARSCVSPQMASSSGA